MIKCILTVGAPSSGKSTWAKAEVAKDPSNWVRINNDDIRAMMNGSVYSADYEKFITDTRNFLVKEALRRGKSVILDNVNANRRHFDTCVKLAKESNVDVMVMEKAFYEELDVLLERDSKREGKAKVGEVVVKKWFKELGGTQHKHYHPRVEILAKRDYTLDAPFTPATQDTKQCQAIISDLDGTLAIFAGKRSPYDASNCDLIDDPNPPVIETVKMYYDSNHSIIFCSGREDKYEQETRRFIEKHLPGVEYKLFMRKSGDMRKDSIIKEEIYRNNIEGKYFVKLVLDDRSSVVQLWRSLGLVCFQVAPGDF